MFTIQIKEKRTSWSTTVAAFLTDFVISEVASKYRGSDYHFCIHFPLTYRVMLHINGKVLIWPLAAMSLF
jgi:hypothetical protein